MKIFPAIDIKDKKCVRLVKGDFDNKTEYRMSPIEQAGKYKDHGFKNLHIVDLDGALTGEISYSVLLSKSPLTNLTHFLSLISIAGNIFILQIYKIINYFKPNPIAFLWMKLGSKNIFFFNRTNNI